MPKRFRRRKKTIPILPILGVGTSALLMPRRGGAKSALDCFKEGSFDSGFWVMTQNLTGYSAFEKKWDFQNMIYGWTPIIAGAVGHYAMNFLGINKKFANLPPPLNRLRL